MKHSYLLIIAFLLLSTTNYLKAQTDKDPSNATVTISNDGFQKGSSQIAIQDFNLGLRSGQAYGGGEIRYGYFIADNNQLFLNAAFYRSYGYNTYNLGLNYRRYFTSNILRPFAQVGVNRTWKSYSGLEYGNTNFRIGGGAAIQIKRFGIEAGLQGTILSNEVVFAPLVGFSFKF